MKVSRAKFWHIFSLILALQIVLTTAIVFPYWNSFLDNQAEATYTFMLGTHDGYYSDDPIENIPEFVPKNIVDKLKELDAIKDQDIINSLIDTVVNIYQYYNFDGDVFVGASADDLFADGSPDISVGDYLIFTVGEGENKEVVVVHIAQNSSFSITSADDLFAGIEQSWTGLNRISIVWLRGTLYTASHAPIEYGGNFYLNINDGDRYVTPENAVSGTWFLVEDDLEYNSYNVVYPKNHIVRSGGEYFIANTAVWNTAPSSEASWAWSVIGEWQGGTVNMGATVRTGQGDDMRFWTALEDTTSAPSEEGARAGKWREIKNAWIGKRGELTTKDHYISHNTYSKDDIVVCGVSAKLQYRYYKAIKDVPFNEPPLESGDDGRLVLNDEYWERWV